MNSLQIPPSQLAETAAAAEQLGFESIWMPDHLVFGTRTESRYPYNPDGNSPVGPDTPFLDPLVALAFVAAATKHLKLGTAVYVLPLRNPVVSAKLAATVDVLSGGRLLLGLGVGWMAEEFAIAGETFDNRAARAEESLQVMQQLWSEGETDFHGEHYDVGPAHMQPKPVQQPHPPILFGGETDAALRRAARLGDGWIGMRHTAETIVPVIEKLDRYRMQAERGSQPFEIAVLGGSAPGADAVRALEDAGADRVIVYPFSPNEQPIAALRDYAEHVVSRV